MFFNQPRFIYTIVASGVLLGSTLQAVALPFSAETTARKSVRRSADGTTVTALTRDSSELVFQDFAFTNENGDTQYEPRYFAFTTTDSTADDNFPAPNGRCQGTTNRQVYWVDDYTGGIRCISYDGTALGAGESYSPKIGGPEGDEGRYVVFESKNPNLFLPRTPFGEQQVVVHDRKADETFLSSSKCIPDQVTPVPTRNPGSTQDVDLWDLSSDGKKMLISTNGSNLPDNLNPLCRSTGVRGLFIRDGGDCLAPYIGDCMTRVLYDRYGYHANSILLLDSDARNAAMSRDGTTTVFDSLATIPTRFNPDVSGFFDVYLHKNEAFSVISRSQVPRCSLTGELLPLKNDNEPGNGNSTRPRVDEVGRYIVFESLATDLVVDRNNPQMICKEGSTLYYPHPKDVKYLNTGGFSQVYVYDAVANTTSLVSKAHNSASGGNAPSGNAWISKDGHYVVFESAATNLLATSTTPQRNIFLRDLVQGKTYLVTLGTGGSGLNRDATISHVSRNGLVIAFETRASDVVAANGNGGSNNSFVQHVYIAQHSCPLDTDGDGVPDCLDLCPSDLLKTQPGSCGCGQEETDEDNDLVPDCIDNCPKDAKKTEPGQCGCGEDETDTDRDSTADCKDECPNDNTKTAPGDCGCGVSENDSDGDGVADCKDSCPSNPSRTGANGCTCTDLKDSPGACGCNTPDTDANGNGVADCLDPTGNTQPAMPTVYITKTTPDNRPAKYQVMAVLQAFEGTVTYNIKLRRGKKTIRRTSSNPTIVFRGLGKGVVTLEYSVTIGSGAAKTTTQSRSVTIKIPTGTRNSKS